MITANSLFVLTSPLSKSSRGITTQSQLRLLAFTLSSVLYMTANATPHASDSIQLG